jgi:uncharacterized FlaG/YvyC family protein
LDNLKHYNCLRTPPKEALRKIEFGNLKNKSDINPQWRYEAMTSEFGTCGIGWKFEIVDMFTKDVPDGQVMVFVKVLLCVYENEKWGNPIPAMGGDFLIKKDKNGIHGNDEAYKMATTDALGTAMKMLGVAADVYRGFSDSKYSNNQQSPSEQKPQTKTTLPKQQTKTATPNQEQKEPSLTHITEEQRKKIGSLAKELSLSADDMKGIMLMKYKIDSSKNLSNNQAGEIIRGLKQFSDEYMTQSSSAEDDKVLQEAIGGK